MQIHDLKDFLVNKINSLELKLSSAKQSGNLELYSTVEKELEDTLQSLAKLNSLE